MEEYEILGEQFIEQGCLVNIRYDSSLIISTVVQLCFSMLHTWTTTQNDQLF